MSDIIIGQRLHEAMNIWKEGNKHELFGYILKGKAINLIKEGKLWVMDCAGVPSFRYYVTKELGISVSEAHRLDQVYREIGKILEKNDLRIKISAVTLLLPFLKGKTDEEKIELIRDNKDLPLEAIRNNLLDIAGKGHLATDVCSHPEFEKYRKCKVCHKFFREENS